ncbi:MAG TPA: M1 family aminopeptidase [Pyrinomonadaceae bacterium]
MKLLILAFFLMMTTSILSQTPPIEAGVSQSLAKWRATNYSDVRYKLNITLEKGAPTLKGTMEIRVNVKQNDAVTKETGENSGSFQVIDSLPLVILDWRKIKGKENLSTISNVSVNGSRVVLNPDSKQLGVIVAGKEEQNFFEFNEHLIFTEGVKTGENVIKLDFTSPIATSGAAITRYVDKEDGAEYVYSLFVPSDASTAFPVIDQPDLKARFQLDLSFPTQWQAVSNSKVKLTERPKCQNLEKCLQAYSFAETKPISTYVFAFAAGDFDNLIDLTNISNDGSANGIVNSVFVRKSQAEKFKQHAAETFRLNREAVKYLESYFDYKFPFPKYDLVLIPEFPFGGMEHAGATFLREDRVIFPTEPTKNDYITRANVIFHEAAHQWFGDTVTMKWFDDLWLKEGFAEFMAYKTLEKVMPEYNAWKIFYERNKQAAYLTDVTRGTTPIYQEIPNLSSAKSAYGNIVYRKAPSFLRQAEFYLGEDKFQTAVRAFLKKHEFANAEWTDLVKEFELASKQNLKDWANVWVKQRGMPIFRTTRNDKQGNLEVTVEQKNILNEKGNVWATQFKLLMKFKNEDAIQKTINFDKENNLVSFVQTCDHCKLYPEFVFSNYQDYGYGIFLLDEKSRAYVLENIQNEKDDFLRSMMWGSVWDSVRFYELAPEEYVRLVIKNINVEQDESTIATLLNRLSTAMNYYLTEERPKQFAPEIEKLLIEKMQNAPTLGERITFYRSFVALASTENARNVLKDILSGKLKIKELDLKTKDKFDIVTKLVTLGDADGTKLLAELEKTYTDDAAKRYAYAARAGVPSAENKAKFWSDFTSNKELSESYIESAFTVFNTPRHADLTLPYLEKSLAELPNLKRNRKIFFVNGWLGAFIGGQKSEHALQIVNKFLADNPNLDKDLRLKILENVDALERAVKIRAKYAKN